MTLTTVEVAEVIRACPGVLDAAVYGVPVPGADGKVGMAALTIEQDAFDLAVLRAHLSARLAAYARPLFVRLCRNLESTGTFRLRTTGLKGEGYENSPDPVWFDDRRQGAFVPYENRLLGQAANS